MGSRFRNLVLSPRLIIIYVLIAAGIIVFDSIALRIFVNLQEDLTFYTNLTIFTAFVLVFVFFSFVFLSLVKKISPPISKLNNSLSFIYVSIVTVQTAITFLLIIIIAQLLFLSYYNVILVTLLIDVTHLSSIVYIAILVWLLIRWYKSRRSYIVMLYAISFSALALTILSSLLYVNYQLSNYPQYVIKKDIMITLAEHVSPDIWEIDILGSVYTQLSMISFVSTWLATVLLLKQYSKRIGIIKYWVLVCIPIIYFFFPFFAQSFGIFEQLRLTFAHRFELIYSIMFAPYKQVGGLLFGMVFLTASSAVRRSEIKVSLLITAAGVILLFGSNIVNGLAVLVSPPFGIVAISYMGLASFLLLTGLMVFTKYTAKDIVIRKELHKSINNDAHLLKNLSLAEIERDIAVKVKPLMEKSINAEKEAYEYDIAEGDIKEILQEVLQELHEKQKDP